MVVVSLLSWAARELGSGNRGREPLGRVRLGSGMGSHFPPPKMLRFHQTPFARIHLQLSSFHFLSHSAISHSSSPRGGCSQMSPDFQQALWAFLLCISGRLKISPESLKRG